MVLTRPTRMKESGLINQWKLRTFRRMRNDMLSRGETSVADVERAQMLALSLDDLQGIFYLFGIFLLMTSIVFAGEVWSGGFGGR